MDSTTKIALGIGGSVLAVSALVGGLYYMNKSSGSGSSDSDSYSPPASRSSSMSSTYSLGSSLGSGWEDSDDSGAATNLFAHGGRRRKTRRNVHRLKLSKKKSKGVRRSHRRAHK